MNKKGISTEQALDLLGNYYPNREGTQVWEGPAKEELVAKISSEQDFS